MMNIADAIKGKLEQLAWEASRPFCYSDYITVVPNEKERQFVLDVGVMISCAKSKV